MKGLARRLTNFKVANDPRQPSADTVTTLTMRT